MFLEPFFHQYGIINTLRSPDNFSIALWSNHVGAEHNFRTVRIWLHVECLNACWIMCNEHRFVVLLSDRRFMRCPKILTPRNIKSLSMKEFNRLIVRNTRERCLNTFQLTNVPTNSF
ncbi:hypothetical protein D3C77_633910 [compost metagenome]